MIRTDPFADVMPFRGRRMFLVLIGLLLVSFGPLAAQSKPLVLRGTVELRIGEGDQPEGPYSFEDLTGLLVDREGRMFVAASGSNQVRAYSPAGKHLYTIGRAGAGPGDLNRPCCLALAADGKLWIREDGNRRYSVFVPGVAKAVFDRTVRMATMSPRGFDRVAWDARGRLVDIGTAGVRDHAMTGVLRSFIDSSGTVRGADTVLPPPEDSLDFFKHPVPGGMATYFASYGASQVRAFGPKGDYAAATNTRYAVTWFDAAGKRVTLIERRIDGPLMSARERSATEKHYANLSERIGQNVPFELPEKKPVLSTMGFDLDGRLWIQRSTADGTPSEADVFSRNGLQVASMTWPRNVQLLAWAVRGTVALGVETDEDGVERVVRVLFK